MNFLPRLFVCEIQEFNMEDYETISDIKRQLKTINDQINPIASDGADQDALLSYSQSIPNLKLRQIKS